MGNKIDIKTGRFIPLEIDEKKILQLHSEGLSYSAIAKEMGVRSVDTIRLRAKKIGLEPNFKKNIPMTVRNGLILCEKCGEYKSLSDYIISKTGKLRFRFCRQCKSRQWTNKLHESYVSFIKHNISQQKHRNKLKGLGYDLDLDYLVNLWDSQKGLCFYTDLPLVLSDKRFHNHNSPSLDKIIPSLGYSKGNVVWTIQRINVMKNDSTLDEMEKWMPSWYSRAIKHLEENNIKF